MSAFLAEYGLWLLIALLIVIVVMFLITSKKPTGALPIEPAELVPPPETPAAPVTPAVAEAVTLPSPPPPIKTAPPAAAAADLFAAEAPATKKPVAGKPAPVPPQPSGGGTDDLLLLKGVGPKLNTLLIELGVTSFAQIAAWTDEDIAAIDTRLGTFKGRPVRDHWVDQARYLADGDTAGFEAKYGKL